MHDAFTRAYDIKDAANNVAGTRIHDSGRRYAGTRLDAFAASRAGIQHLVNASV
jgi:hypothetical protein